MITAAQARNRTLASTVSDSAELKIMIKKEIESTCDRGLSSVWIPTGQFLNQVVNSVKNDLILLGYKVESNSRGFRVEW